MFLEQFDEEFAPRLGQRAASFRVIFRELERLAEDRAELRLVETGCARVEGNWAGDGMSTVLFDAFLRAYPGRLDSYDISPQACAVARRLVGPERVTVHCEDSVAGLHAHPGPIDLLYLDSYDIDFSNPHPSATHHLRELEAALPKLSPGALVVVDDNLPTAGKGMLVRQALDAQGVECLFDGYQLVFRV